MTKLLPILFIILFAWLQLRRSEAAMARDLAAKTLPLQDPALRAVVERFRAVMEAEQLDVHLYDTAVINGLATPKGGIYLTRGLVDRYRNGAFEAAEIAGVIAHEIGHLALGHHERRRAAWRVEVAARAALMAVFPRALGGLAGYATNFVTRVLHLGLSRRDEYQADAFAAGLMARAGYDPAAQITLLGKLDRLARGRGQPVSWLASHPPTPKRIAALEEVIGGQRR